MDTSYLTLASRPGPPEVHEPWEPWMIFLGPPPAGETAPEGGPPPPPSRGHRRGPEDWFYRWVLQYAAINPTCPPLFRRLVDDEVLIPGLPEQVSKDICFGLLRNPDITRFGFSPEFWVALERYNLCDYLDPGIADPTIEQSPLAYIPARYLPDPSLGRQHQPPPVVELGPDDDEVKVAEPPGPLEQIPRGVDIQGFPIQGPAPRGFLSGLTQTNQDWANPSWYGNVPQPPLARRLLTILHFLADEDRDRTPEWEERRAETVKYLHWLATVDPSHQLAASSQQTREMFECAVDMAMTHALFEKHYHGGTSALRISKPEAAPVRSTRLNYLIDPLKWPLPTTRGAPDKSLLVELPIPARPVEAVNIDLTADSMATGAHAELILQSRAFWAPVAGVVNAETSIPSEVVGDARTNIAYREHRTFEFYSRPGNTGWAVDDTLPHRDSLQGGPATYAAERGARRAGLQKMLRYFNTTVHDATYSPRQQLTLPDETALEKADRINKTLPWRPPSLSDDELPAKRELETHPYDVTYTDFAAKAALWRRLALHQTLDEFSNTLGWVSLSSNIINGGPFIFRKIGPVLQAQQDLLKQCLTTEKLLRAAYRKWPRRLLRRVIKAMDDAISSDVTAHSAPAGITLAADELVTTPRPLPPGRAATTPRQMDSYDLYQLKFLASPGVSEGTYQRRCLPELPEETYKLYQIFARRVQKVLDDKNPQGLLASKNVRVSVEQLLSAINPGGGTFAAKKVRFGPWEACSYLDRLAASGHIKFKLDPTCYGVVELPDAQYFPENRVHMPAGSSVDPARPRPKIPGHVTPWESIFNAVERPPAKIATSHPIYNFFVALGYRLGYTICQLKHIMRGEAARPAPRPTISPQAVREAYGKFEAKCRENTSADTSLRYHWYDPGQVVEELEHGGNFVVLSRNPLSTIRMSIINEVHENKTMLAPAREVRYSTGRGASASFVSEYVRDITWDWAIHPTNLTRQRRWWKLDRWPVSPGWYLEDSVIKDIASDADLDPKFTYNPTNPDLDPINQAYKRFKLRPYAEKPFKFRRGPAVYPAGDTKYQRDKVEEHITREIHIATGVPLPGQKKWQNRLLRYLTNTLAPTGLFEEAIDDGTLKGKLPDVKQEDVPGSWDPHAELRLNQFNYLKRRKVREELAEGGPSPDKRKEVRDRCGKKRRKLGSGDFEEVGDWYGQ